MAWWDRLAGFEDWHGAVHIGQLCAKKFPRQYFGWENWAWALHKSGKTQAAYDLLAPVLKGLRLPGAPSGRAAYCLACFCASLGRLDEGAKWLRLALIQASDRAGFREHAFQDLDLEPLWAALAGLEAVAA